MLKLIPKKQIGGTAPLSHGYDYNDNILDYEKMKYGVPAKVTDAIIAAGTLAGPFTGGATVIPSAAIAAYKGLGAVVDMFKNGVDRRNLTDAISSVAPLSFAKKNKTQYRSF